jgi:hypothetical protein
MMLLVLMLFADVDVCDAVVGDAHTNDLSDVCDEQI